MIHITEVDNNTKTFNHKTSQRTVDVAFSWDHTATF